MRLFVSYSSKDSTSAKPLIRDLETTRHAVWVDQDVERLAPDPRPRRTALPRRPHPPRPPPPTTSCIDASIHCSPTTATSGGAA